MYVSDLLNPPLPGFKLFEELILDFDISRKGRQKYNFFMKNIPELWFDNPTSEISHTIVFDRIVENLLDKNKVPKYTYSVMNQKCIPEKQMKFWSELFDDSISGMDLNSWEDWETIHLNNFKCSIDTRLRYFYFKIFHRAIAFNNFLFKIKRKDSPNCHLCDKFPETITHIFCDCEIVKPIKG